MNADTPAPPAPGAYAARITVAAAKLLELLAAGPIRVDGTGVRELAERFGVSPAQVSTAIDRICFERQLAQVSSNDHVMRLRSTHPACKSRAIK